MGNVATYRRNISERDISMDPDESPTFDHQLGFNEPRQKRVMIATEEEMMAAMIPHDMRDYCAHILLKMEGCKADHFPLIYKCAHIKHEYEQCQFDDYVMRMKEYERERRLRKLALKEKSVEA